MEMCLVNKKTEKVDVWYPVTYFPHVSLARPHLFNYLTDTARQ